MKRRLVAPAEHTRRINPHMNMQTRTCSDAQMHTHIHLQRKPSNKHYFEVIKKETTVQ